MRVIPRTVRIWLGVAALFGCLLGSGCESMIDGIADNLTHNSRVNDYEHHGLSHRDAERRVFEDDFYGLVDEKIFWISAADSVRLKTMTCRIFPSKEARLELAAGSGIPI